MQRRETLDHAVSVAAAGRLGRDDLCEKVTFRLRSLRPGVSRHGKIWRRNSPGRGKNKVKGMRGGRD